MPLPARYVLIVGPAPVLEFNSRSLNTLISPIGYVRAGPLQAYIDKYRQQYKGRKTVDVKPGTGGGLKITIIDPPANFPALTSFKTVLIHDDRQFLLITDENQELWKAMLETYDELRLQPQP